MGNVKVVLQFGKSTKFLEPNGWIDGVINDGTLGDLKSMVPSIQKMLPKLDSILGSVKYTPCRPSSSEFGTQYRQDYSQSYYFYP